MCRSQNCICFSPWNSYLIVLAGKFGKMCFFLWGGKLSVGKYMTILIFCVCIFFEACSADSRVKQDADVPLIRITHPIRLPLVGQLGWQAKGKLSLREIGGVDDDENQGDGWCLDQIGPISVNHSVHDINWVMNSHTRVICPCDGWLSNDLGNILSLSQGYLLPPTNRFFWQQGARTRGWH